MRTFLLFCFVIAGGVLALSWHKNKPIRMALDAFGQGEYAWAKSLLEPLAEPKVWSRKRNARAQYWLGVMHENGYGIPQNHVAAVTWYQLAAEQELAGAQHNLGNMYYDGRGVPKDYMAALQWFRLAAKQGEASAQHKLGVMHEEGQDVAQSYEAAVEQYQLAAKQGFAKAQMSLGDMYKGGHGIPQNYIRAYVCYSLVAAAAAQGDDSASKLRDEVAGKMVSLHLEKAQKLATKRHKKDYKGC